jgi:4-diphosphocytidyl-2-C-methyl-D-erythritol kinase
VPYRAYAKLNLSLEVLGRRSDGFHELVSVMQEVSLHDDLVFERSTEDSLVLHGAGSSISPASNLVTIAATALRRETGIEGGYRATLLKRIPVAAGLGGGSSDAAATLRALCDLWSLSMELRRMQAIGAQVGSDVPYFLTGGTCLVEGRGERVTKLRTLPKTWYMLARLDTPVSTRDVFEALCPDEWGDGTRTRELARAIDRGEAFLPGTNSLQGALFRLYPAVAHVFEHVARLNPGRTFISGSGPTVFSMYSGEDAAREACRQLPPNLWSAVVHSVSGAQRAC